MQIASSSSLWLFRITIFLLILTIYQARASKKFNQASNGRYMKVHHLRIAIPWKRFESMILQIKDMTEAENMMSCNFACYEKIGCITSVLRISNKKCYILRSYIGSLEEYDPKIEEDPSTQMTVAAAMDPCQPHPCHRSAKCIKMGDGYKCNCPHNRTGLQCFQRIMGKSCLDIKNKYSDLSLESGMYRIIPSTGKAFAAYCEMREDEGGWTRVAHVYSTTTDRGNLSLRVSYLNKLNFAENLNFVMKTGALQELQNKIAFKQFRFKCKSHEKNSTIHIKTNNSTVVDYLVGRSNVQPNACGTFTRLADDNSYLTRNCEKWGLPIGIKKWGIPSETDKILAFHPFFEDTVAHWTLIEQGRFECDTGMNSGISVNDFWDIFVK
eukprot:gene12897-14225_t